MARATDTEQVAALFWRCGISHVESFRPSPNINYICVPTAEEVKKGIIFALETLLLQGQPTLAQFWAAKKTGNAFVLTTTSQPFGILGISEELVAYHKACLDHKLYVYRHPEDPTKEVAFGLPGRVFLRCTADQTTNVHRCPPDQRPPCEDAIFSREWGSFALPVIVVDECVGVLEFVTDTPSSSFEHDIDEVYRALKNAGLQSSKRINGTGWAYIQPRERTRITPSFYTASYCCLAPHFGLSSAEAAQKLGLKRGTFRNVCRDVGIREWPRIPSTATRASSASETPNNQTELDTAIADLISSWEEECSCEQTMMTIATAQETQTNQDMEEWINEYISMAEK